MTSLIPNLNGHINIPNRMFDIGYRHVQRHEFLIPECTFVHPQSGTCDVVFFEYLYIPVNINKLLTVIIIHYINQ